MGLTSDFDDDKEEEKIVRRMATGWLQVMQDNPQLVKFLAKKPKV